MSVTALANTFARYLPDDNLSLAAAIFPQLGDTLATISQVRALCPDRQEEPGENPDFHTF